MPAMALASGNAVSLERGSGMWRVGGTMVGDGFPELLGQLKERSGLSYGVLGKRLHMSASTLHRYVNGDVVPADYAPVERFARVCKATPEELVELHRRWVLADARRRQKGAVTSVAVEGSGAADEGREPEPGTVSEPKAVSVAGRRRRTGVLAGAGVVAVVLSGALVASLGPGDAGDGHGDGGGEQHVAGAASAGSQSPGTGADSSASPSRGSSASSSESPSSSASPSPGPGPDATDSATAGESGGEAAGGTEAGDVTAPAVVTEPYHWDSPCSQHYLMNREPGQVPPPPTEDDARGWVTALGGVAAGEQWVRLTVQGTGENTVVLEGLEVRVVERDTPLPWNDYVMGVDACGGPVETRHFGVDLDAGRPEVTPEAGQRDFPYQVSETDPEVYYVTARTQAHDVNWYLELEWSSGGQRGTVRIDDDGRPFRTSGNAARPAYDYPLGYNDRWEVADGEPGAPTSQAHD
ncbi:helix-turn-helix domain-containing protein [Streptomyces sp. 6N223]|uniref:helix-turn-helix domain-containing protein n=1 Tax=Streptomyces sp. 6N223 TaxID=3457412 RepID=UPI003FD5C3FC